MAKGVNKVILLGRLGGEPESRQAGSTTVANFTIATSEKFKNQQGELQEKTEWHRVVAWGRLAEICKEYLHKGSQVYVEGRLQTRNWEKEGVKQYTTEIVISDMQMLDGKPSGQAYMKELHIIMNVSKAASLHIQHPLLSRCLKMKKMIFPFKLF